MKYAWLTGVLALGCTKHIELEIAMRPEEAALVRTVRETRNGRLPASFDRSAYDVRAPGVASGRFTDELPGELGGTGFFRRFDSDLGSATIYTERLAPRRSLWALVEEVGAAGDRCVELVLGWLRWQLRDSASAGALDDSTEVAFRNGLKEAALYLALPLDAEPAAPGLPGGLPIVLHELLSSGWLELADLPAFARLADIEDDDDLAAWFMTRLRDGLAGFLELAPDDPALAFVADVASVEASWRAWVAAGGARGVADPPAPDSAPWQAFEPLIEAAGVGFALFRDTTHVAVELEVAGDVVATNGTPDSERAAIRWAPEDVAGSGYHPGYRFAVWVAPDDAAQRARFGAVRVAGSDLLGYALWFAGLAPAEEARWRELAARLEPGTRREELGPAAAGLGGGVRVLLDALREPGDEPGDTR